MIKFRRLMATIIDFFIILLTGFLFYINILDVYIKNENILFIIALTLFVGSFFIKDMIFKNRSIGKLFLGLKIVSNDNKVLGIKKLIQRNIYTFLKMDKYALDIIKTNKSIGDLKCNTSVVSRKYQEN